MHVGRGLRGHAWTAGVRIPPGQADEGLRAAGALRGRHPGLPVLVLGQYVQRSYAAGPLDSGGGSGAGYLLKDRIGQIEEFLTVVGAVGAVTGRAARRMARRAGGNESLRGRLSRSGNVVAPHVPRRRTP